MDVLSTGSVAELLHVPTHRIDYPLRDRRIRPAKGPTGAFFWEYPDVIEVAQLLDLRPPSQLEFREAVHRSQGARATLSRGRETRDQSQEERSR